MSKLADLKAKAAAVSANIHQDITAYVTALEAKVSANKYVTYAAVGLAIVVIVGIWHAFKK